MSDSQNDLKYTFSNVLINNKKPCLINFSSKWDNKDVPTPKSVIYSLIDNGYNCSKFKLFDRNIEVLKTMKFFNKKALVGFNNWELTTIINDNNFAKNEIRKLLPYKDVIDTFIVANEPLGAWYNNEFTYLLNPALKIISNTLKELMPNKKITIPHNFAIFVNTYPPSNSMIDSNYENILDESINIIKNHSNDSIMMINIYPYLTYEQNINIIDINFALGIKSLSRVYDDKYIYNSLFTLMYDSAYVAFQKKNYNIPIEIGEVGWPNNGGIEANTENECEALHQLQIDTIVGTPRNPGPINIYLFEAIDEPWKDIGPGLFETHWGIINSDLTPKCNYLKLPLLESTNNNYKYLFLPFIPLLFCLFSCLYFKIRTNKYKTINSKIKLTHNFNNKKYNSILTKI